MITLRQLRKSKSLTLTDVAEILGISPMQMSRIERGIHELKVQYAVKLGEIYGVNWYDLYNNSKS